MFLPIHTAGTSLPGTGTRLERSQRAYRNHGGQPLYPRARNKHVQHHEHAAMACIRRYGSLAAAVQVAGSHGVALLSHRRVSSFVCNSLQAARRTPIVHLHTRVRVFIGTHTVGKNTLTNVEGCIGRRRKWSDGEGGREWKNGRSTHLTLQGEPVRPYRNRISS